MVEPVAQDSGTLYVVATPLGNLEDISARALRILAEVHIIFAEDTRRSGQLLHHFGIRKTLVSLHEHNEKARSAEVQRALSAGHDVAYVSDAGTPAVSDPGARLVADIAALGFVAVPVPGPSALAAALSVAGFVESSTNVLFVGFVPQKGKERQRVLQQLSGHRGVAVFFEAPHRVAQTLTELAAHDDPNRAVSACRELTKLYEEVRRGTLAEIQSWSQGQNSSPLRGELTIVLGPKPDIEDDQDASGAAIDQALRRCLGAGLSPKDASTAVAAILEKPKRQVYQQCLRVSHRNESS